MSTELHTKKSELEVEIIEMSKNGLNLFEVLGFNVELSRCIVESDFRNLEQKILRRKEELGALLTSGLFKH